MFGRVGERKIDALCGIKFWEDQERAKMLSLEKAKKRRLTREKLKSGLFLRRYLGYKSLEYG